MRRLSFVLFLIAVSSTAGCTIYDIMFDTLGSRHYSGAGPSDADRRADYNERLHAYGAE